MARLRLNPTFEGISGKACCNSKVIYATNTQTGTSYSYERHSVGELNSTAQQEHRANFSARGKKVKEWFAANKPSEANPKGTELYQAARAKYKAQHKIGSMAGFVAKYLQDDGTMGAAYVYPKTSASASSGSAVGTTNPPAGGGGVTEIEED